MKNPTSVVSRTLETSTLAITWLVALWALSPASAMRFSGPASGAGADNEDAGLIRVSHLYQIKLRVSRLPTSLTTWLTPLTHLRTGAL